MLTLGFAFMASLLFESPFIGLEKLIFGRKPRSKPNIPNLEVRMYALKLLMSKLYVYKIITCNFANVLKICILSRRGFLPDDFSGYFVL